jgi:hypothetical protein
MKKKVQRDVLKWAARLKESEGRMIKWCIIMMTHCLEINHRDDHFSIGLGNKS